MNERFPAAVFVTLTCGISFAFWQESIAAGIFMSVLLFTGLGVLEDFR